MWQQATVAVIMGVVPPAVATTFTGGSGESLDSFTDWIFKGLKDGQPEIRYGTSVDRQRMSRDEVDVYIENMYQAMTGAIG